MSWIENEAGRSGEPWCLWVSFVTPHFPYVCPQDYFDLYPLDEVEWPINGSARDWPDHPAARNARRLSMSIPGGEFPEETLRQAIAAYYGLVTFTDHQIGRLLNALERSGLTKATRVMYTSDHGEMLGDFGQWGRAACTRRRSLCPWSRRVPESPKVRLSSNRVACGLPPRDMQAVGVEPQGSDADLPGTSLWDIATGRQCRDESVFSEYHAIYSPHAQYMLRDSRYKYVYHAGGLPPQLFDMLDDPLEQRDLGQDQSFRETVNEFESRLREVLDPDDVDRQAKADQQARLQAHGGVEEILRQGSKGQLQPHPAGVSLAVRATRIIRRTQAAAGGFREDRPSWKRPSGRQPTDAPPSHQSPR